MNKYIPCHGACSRFFACRGRIEVIILIELNNTVTPYCQWTWLQDVDALDEYRATKEKAKFNMSDTDYATLYVHLPTFVGCVYDADRWKCKRHFMPWSELCREMNRVRKKLMEEAKII